MFSIEQYESLIIKTIKNDDKLTLSLLSKMLFESEQAKQELRNKGYGWTGLSLLLTVQQEVPTIRNDK